MINFADKVPKNLSHNDFTIRQRDFTIFSTRIKGFGNLSISISMAKEKKDLLPSTTNLVGQNAIRNLKSKVETFRKPNFFSDM